VSVHFFGHEIEQELAVEIPEKIEDLAGLDIPAGWVDESESEAIAAGGADLPWNSLYAADSRYLLRNRCLMNDCSRP
jgi:hypothetical protein